MHKWKLIPKYDCHIFSGCLSISVPFNESLPVCCFVFFSPSVFSFLRAFCLYIDKAENSLLPFFFTKRFRALQFFFPLLELFIQLTSFFNWCLPVPLLIFTFFFHLLFCNFLKVFSVPWKYQKSSFLYLGNINNTFLFYVVLFFLLHCLIAMYFL